jgi:hypothetical protein
MEFSGEFWSMVRPKKAIFTLYHFFCVILFQVFIAAAEGKIRIAVGNRPRWF